MTFFGQDGVEKFFFYFSLKAFTKVSKISHSKKISLAKNFYLKIAVSALGIPYLHSLGQFHNNAILHIICSRSYQVNQIDQLFDQD